MFRLLTKHIPSRSSSPAWRGGPTCSLCISLIVCGLWADMGRAELPGRLARHDIGWAALEQRLSATDETMPTGRDVAVAHVESHGRSTSGMSAALPQAICYMPDISLPDFAGKTFRDRSEMTNPPGDVSPHATNMGRHFYGLQGLAPGINQIDVYYSDHWLFGGKLKTGSAGQFPEVERCRVQSHSWVASMDMRIEGQPVNFNDEILKRFDYLLDRDQVLAAVGRTDDAKPLLGRAYNAISVGTSQAGGEKPHIVVPAPSTSLATAWVAACAALLIETAEQTPSPREAELASRNETIRAVLLAGATKHEREFSSPWQRTSTEPLDPRYGVGELNIDRSHAILSAGRQEARDDQLVSLVGWDFCLARPGRKRLYFFEVDKAESIGSISVVATWNRHVSLRRLTADLANIDLRLLHVEGGFELGEVVGGSQGLGESLSVAGNVEHLFLEDLPGGRYAIEVTSNEPWDVALAWDVQLARPASLRSILATTVLGLVAALVMVQIYRREAHIAEISGRE